MTLHSLRHAPAFTLLSVEEQADLRPVLARVSQATGAATTFTAPIRIVRPGAAVTEDFNPARTNSVLDANERVTQVYRG